MMGQLIIEYDDFSRVLFAQTVRKLLDGTFILKEKHTKEYNFVLSMNHREQVIDYLELIGYSLQIHEEHGCIMLVSMQDFNEANGLSRTNFKKFNKMECKFLLCLMEYYSRMNQNYKKVECTLEQLKNELETDNIKFSNKTEILDILQTFNRYNLISYSQSTQMITLYSSLLFVMRSDELNRVFKMVKDILDEKEIDEHE